MYLLDTDIASTKDTAKAIQRMRLKPLSIKGDYASLTERKETQKKSFSSQFDKKKAQTRNRTYLMSDSLNLKVYKRRRKVRR